MFRTRISGYPNITSLEAEELKIYANLMRNLAAENAHAVEAQKVKWRSSKEPIMGDKARA